MARNLQTPKYVSKHLIPHQLEDTFWPPVMHYELDTDAIRGVYNMRVTIDRRTIEDALVSDPNGRMRQIEEGVQNKVYAAIRNAEALYEKGRAFDALDDALRPIKELLLVGSTNLSNPEEAAAFAEVIRRVLRKDEEYIYEVDKSGQTHQIHLSPLDIMKSL